jgi:hypothetical protein
LFPCCGAQGLRHVGEESPPLSCSSRDDAAIDGDVWPFDIRMFRDRCRRMCRDSTSAPPGNLGGHAIHGRHRVAPNTVMANDFTPLDDLQRHKLELEIRQLKSAWRSPSAIAPIATILVTLLAFVSAVHIGYFDKARLDFERAQLASNIDALKSEKASLQSEGATLRANISSLQTQKAAIESALQRRIAEADASVRSVVGINHDLAKANEDYVKANQAFVERNRKDQEELAGLRKATADAKERQAVAERVARTAQRQLSLYPPLAKQAQLTHSTSDGRVTGKVTGANLGSGRGRVQIRVVKKGSDPKSPAVLVEPMELGDDAVLKWSPGRLEFDLPLRIRNLLMEGVKSEVSRARALDWEGLYALDAIEFELRIRTVDETSTDWAEATRMKSWSTGPIRAGTWDDD